MNRHGANQSGDQKLQQRVEQQVRRIEKADQERRTLLSQTMYLGAIGVMLALPIVAGAYLGRWLDTLMQGYAVRWTVSMIFLGIIVGAVNVYLFVRE
jgi:ATP synthase protein I